MNELPELPNGWEWQSGNRGNGYYNTFFGTEYRQGGAYAGKYGLGGMHGCVYWDGGDVHHIEICYVESIDKDGDATYSYPILTDSFETEEEAHNAVPELIEQL